MSAHKFDESGRQSGRVELGFRIVNPEAPPEQTRFEPISPDFQRFSERLFWRIRQEGATQKPKKE